MSGSTGDRRPPAIECHESDAGPTLRIATLDIETTGLDFGCDELIELGVQWVDVSASTGRVVAIGPHEVHRESPTRPLSAQACRILGTTDDALKGHHFDDAAVEASLLGAELLVSHRASFDRPFLERRFPFLARVAWSCSIEEVDWRARGTVNASLDAISAHLGWKIGTVDAARDSQLIAAVLSVSWPPDGRTGFSELIAAERQSEIRLHIPSNIEVPRRVAHRLGLEQDASGRFMKLRGAPGEELQAATHDLLLALPGLTVKQLRAEKLDSQSRFSGRPGRRIKV